MSRDRIQLPAIPPQRPTWLESLTLRWRRWRVKRKATAMMNLLKRPLAVRTPAGTLSFVPLGSVAAGRGLSIMTKQPDTIAWIDRFEPGSVFWDVGANVGVFSLYAAKRGAGRVVAIEPAAVNYFLLSANCEASKLADRIDCLALCLGAGAATAELEISQFAGARSFETRGKGKYPSRQASLVLSMDELIEQFGLPCPNYIKIDTPGMSEHIINGAMRTLRRPEVRELHIELRAQSKAGRRIVEALARCGLAPSGEHTHGATTDVTFIRAAPPV